MKTFRNAAIVVAAALTLLALVVPPPADAKDQWIIAFGEEPFSLNPANKGASAAVSDYVQIHIYDALVDYTRSRSTTPGSGARSTTRSTARRS